MRRCVVDIREDVLFEDPARFTNLAGAVVDGEATDGSARRCIDLLPAGALSRAISAMICERRVLLVSAHHAALELTAEALRQLVAPLHFNMVFIPVLARTLLYNLECPAAFLMGTLRTNLTDPEFPQDLTGVCIFDLDTGDFDFADKGLGAAVQPWADAVAREIHAVRLSAASCQDEIYAAPPESDQTVWTVMERAISRLLSGVLECGVWFEWPGKLASDVLYVLDGRRFLELKSPVQRGICRAMLQTRGLSDYILGSQSLEAPPAGDGHMVKEDTG